MWHIYFCKIFVPNYCSVYACPFLLCSQIFWMERSGTACIHERSICVAPHDVQLSLPQVDLPVKLEMAFPLGERLL